MNTELAGFLDSDEVVDIVDAVIDEMTGTTVSPKLVTFVESLLPDDLQILRPNILELALGTVRARGLGKAHHGWLYTSRMAEQSTHPQIATHHASRFAGCRSIVEICTGAGHDALAISRVCDRVVSFEADETVAAITLSNLQRSGVTNVQVVSKGWYPTVALPSDVDGIWSDPSRRVGQGSRSRSIATHEPPVEEILTWANQIPDGVVGIKLGPADLVPEPIQRRVAQEYIGYGRECREQIIWKGLGSKDVWVTLVDAGLEWHPRPRGASAFESDTRDEAYLIEPHAAVIAAGLVEELFAEAGVQALDPQIAYGVSDTAPAASPLYQMFAVLCIDTGISEKKIRGRLRELGWGARTEFKKRGWDGEPESLRKLIDDPQAVEAGVVIIARRDPGHVTIYATRIPENEKGTND